MVEHAEDHAPAGVPVDARADREADSWHGETVDSWRGRWGVPALRIFPRVGSTNDVAKAMADDGAEQGTLVLADEQTRGRGRRGRAWSALPGSSLSMSMVIRPPTPGASRALTLRLGLAAARAIESHVPVPITIKWPNDLQAGGRKLAGILCEATIVEDRVVHVIAGMGINVRTPHGGWPDELAGRATALEEEAEKLRREAGGSLGPESPGTGSLDPELVRRVVEEWLAVAGNPAGALSPDEMLQFEARDALRGRDVTVDDQPAGEAAGITETGALLVRGRDGVRAIAAGTVRAMEPTAGERHTRGDQR